MNSTVALFILIINVLISCVSQIILKKEANKKHESKAKEVLNKGVLIGYVIFFYVMTINVFMYKYVDLGLIGVIEAISFVFIPLLSCVFLKEKIFKMKAIGICLIITGIVIFTLGKGL